MRDQTDLGVEHIYAVNTSFWVENVRLWNDFCMLKRGDVKG